MSYAIDTNVLARSIQESHPMRDAASKAVDTLINRGETLCIFPQNLYEFWVVATRPTPQNGLGLSAGEALSHLEVFESFFSVLPDSSAVYSAWKALVTDHSVMGKAGHDTRIVAAMVVHGIENLLTFNTADFKRFIAITTISPEDLK